MPEPSAPRRLGAAPLQWHIARWRHAEPGGRGLLVLGLLTLLLVIPVERLGADLTWENQIRLIVLVGTLAAAMMVGRNAALRDDAEYWLVHLGFTPADWAIAKWAANLLPLIGLTFVWSLCVAAIAGTVGNGVNWIGILGLFIQLSSCALVFTVLFLLMGAAGSSQPAEVGLVLLLFAMLFPAFSESIPALISATLRTVLPPLAAVAQFRSGITDARWRDAFVAALQVATWCGVALAVSMALLRRRRLH